MKGEFTFGSHSILLIKIRVVRKINHAFGGHGVCGLTAGSLWPVT